MTSIRVGLAGAGLIAARHVAAYGKEAAGEGRARLAAIADIEPGRAAALAAGPAAGVYGDYRAMIREADIDAVDICLPHHLHAPAIIAAAQQGKHVLCEKPLCLTMAEADQIAGAVEAAGVTLMCSHNRLFSPVATKTRELLGQGLLGQVYEVRATDCFRNDTGQGALGWRARLDLAGGGELIDTGYHPTYLVLALAGGAPVEVLAMTSRHRLTWLDGEDSAQVLVRFDNGALGHIATSWAYQAPGCFEHFSVTGEHGVLHSTRTLLSYQLDGQEPVTFAFPKGDDIAAAISHFTACLASGQQPLATHREGTQALATVLAAYESQASRSVAPVRLSCRSSSR